MSDRTMLEPTPELPDDTLISGVELPARIRTVLTTAGLETVGEVRETSDEILLSFHDFGKASVTHLRETLGLPSTEGVRPFDKKKPQDSGEAMRISHGIKLGRRRKTNG